MSFINKPRFNIYIYKEMEIYFLREELKFEDGEHKGKAKSINFQKFILNGLKFIKIL